MACFVITVEHTTAGLALITEYCRPELQSGTAAGPVLRAVLPPGERGRGGGGVPGAGAGGVAGRGAGAVPAAGLQRGLAAAVRSVLLRCSVLWRVRNIERLGTITSLLP